MKVEVAVLDCQNLANLRTRTGREKNNTTRRKRKEKNSSKQTVLFRTSSRCRHHNKTRTKSPLPVRVQELYESRGGRPGLSVLMSLTVSVDIKQH